MTKYLFFCKFFIRSDKLVSFEWSHIMGWVWATLFFDGYKIVQSLQGRSYILCFETVLGINKITPGPFPPPFHPLKIKNFQKLNFLMMFLNNLFNGVGVSYFVS